MQLCIILSREQDHENVWFPSYSLQLETCYNVFEMDKDDEKTNPTLQLCYLLCLDEDLSFIVKSVQTLFVYYTILCFSGVSITFTV